MLGVMLNWVAVWVPLLVGPVEPPSTVTVDLLADRPKRAPIMKLPLCTHEMSVKEDVEGVEGVTAIGVGVCEKTGLHTAAQMDERMIIFLIIFFNFNCLRKL